jgi:hypothetical protein
VKGILQKRCREKHDRGKIIFAFEGGLADQFCHFLFAYYFSKKHREKKIYFFADTCSTKFGKEANVNHISGFKLLNYNIRDMMDFEMVSLSREELKYYGDNKLYRINYFGAYPLDSKYNISLKKVKDLKECLIKKAYFPPLTKKQQKRVSKIREKIKLITPLNSENLLKLEQIKNSNSVSLHIRRGDMSGVSSFVSKKYMEKAINKILTLTKWEKMTLFIFSQDDWIKNNLTYDANRVDVDFVNINSESEGYFDIELIRNCKHHITSVGSFSWLGTFLDKNKDKIVIYPDVNNKEDWEDYSKHKQVFF